MTTEQRDILIKLAISTPRTVEAPADLGDAIYRDVLATRQQRGLLRLGRFGSVPRPALVFVAVALLVLLVTAVIAAGLAQRQLRPHVLAMYHGGPERTGVMVGPGPAGVPTIQWDVERPGPVAFTTMPLVVDGRVLVADGSGTAAALDAMTGAIEWEAGLGAASRATPVLVNDLFIVGTDAGQLIALRIVDGTRAWSTTVGASAISASLVEADGRILVATQDGSIDAIDARTGTVDWASSIGGPVLHGGALSAGVLYVGDERGRLAAIDAATGAERWHLELGPGAVGTPAVANGSLYVSRGLLTSRGDLVVLDPRDGHAQWTFDAPSGQLVYAGAVTASTLYAVSDDGNVYGVDLATHAVRWTAPTNGPLGTLGVLVDGIFYAATNARSVYGFDAATGAQLWKIDVIGSPTQPAVVDGRLFLGTTLGHVIAIGDRSTAGATTGPP